MVIESQFKITNIPWNDTLNDPNSEIFQDLKLNLEMELDKTFCNNSDNDRYISPDNWKMSDPDSTTSGTPTDANDSY